MTRILSIFLALASLASAQQTLFRQVFDPRTDTHVEAVALFSHPSLGGYQPVRIVIANNQKIPHKIFLNFKDATSYDDSLATSSEFSYTVAPLKTVTYDILVPLTAQNGNISYHSFEARLSGTMGNTQDSTSSVFQPAQTEVLLSESLYTPNGSALDTESQSRSGGSSYGRSGAGFSSKFDPKQLPDDWRAFSGFDTIMLTETDWSSIPPGARNAIVSWIRLGGQLVIFSTGNPTFKALGLPEDTSSGSVSIKSLPASLTLDPKSTVDITTSERTLKTRLTSVTEDFSTLWPLQKDFGEKSFNYVAFVIILIIFGIIVGPVNLFVFAKSGRRHRLFITTPLISIVTSLILIGLIILQDGFGGKGTRLVLMEVRPDENQNAAFIHQEQFSRTGVMTSPSFTINASSLIVPIPLEASRWARFTDDYNTRGIYDLQPTDGKLFANGSWFQSRSEQGQLLTAVIPTRGRIEAARDGDSLISTFDFPIDTLFFKDATGNWHRAENITKGRPVKLTSVDPTMVLPILNKTAKQFTERNRSFFDKTRDRNDHFIALTSSAPGIATHPGIEWKTQTVITGPIAR